MLLVIGQKNVFIAFLYSKYKQHCHNAFGGINKNNRTNIYVIAEISSNIYEYEKTSRLYIIYTYINHNFLIMNDSIVIHMNIIILSSSWYMPFKSFFKTSEFQSFY